MNKPTNQIKVLIFSILIGILMPFLFSYLILIANYPEYYKLISMKILWTHPEYATVLRLSVLINLPIFMLLIQFNKDYFAKGILIGTMIIGAYILLLHFM
jgi:hypothetical protein